MTRRAIEKNELSETYILGFRQSSCKKEYLAPIEIDQVVQILWYSKAKERHICRKDCIRAGAIIWEILAAALLQISMNNSKTEIRPGELWTVAII